MTNVRVMQSFTEHEYRLDKEATEERKSRRPITEEEIQFTLQQADKIGDSYFRKRAKALVSLARLFGKRRSEVASIEMDDLEVTNNELTINFTLSKKRKRGLFQYKKYLETRVRKGQIPYKELADKTQKQLEDEWKRWQQTKEGINEKKTKSLKSVDASSLHAKLILDYLLYVKLTYPNAKFLFPLGKAVFNEYKVYDDKHLSGDRLFRILKELNPNLWMHLFRELKGGEVAKKYGRTMEAVTKVKTTLDLEKEETAWAYIRRSVPDKLD